MPMTLERIMRMVERQKRDLDQITAALQELRGLSPIKVSGMSLDQYEKRLVLGALQKTKFNKSEAARLLHIGRDRLRYKMRKYKISD